MDELDSLEDWVSIKEHPFLDNFPKSRLNFHIAWNDVLRKFAITCREGNSIVSDVETQVWADVFSVTEICSIHEQLSLVHPNLFKHFPNLPREPQGLWVYVSQIEPLDSSACNDIQKYLEIALDHCGKQLLISTMFEEHSYEEYFEKIGELKRRKYNETINYAEEMLKNVLFLRDGAINMLDLLQVYSDEDSAIFKLNIALAQYYNYLLQPFLDTRELAYSKVCEAKQGLKAEHFGPRRKAEYADMFSEWQSIYSDALDNIHELYIEYYAKTCNILSEKRDRMLKDQKHYGKHTFKVSTYERLQMTEEDLSLERIQLFQNKKLHMEHERDKLKEEIASLTEGKFIQSELDALEESVYEMQNKVYEYDLNLINEQEVIVLRNINLLQVELKASEEEVNFFDTVEKMDVVNSGEVANMKINPKIAALQQQLSSISRKKASVRNKKQSMKEKHRGKKLKNLDEQQEQIQKKDDLEAFRYQERKKTIERLKQYKMKHPSPATIKPRQKIITSSGSGGDHQDGIDENMSLLFTPFDNILKRDEAVTPVPPCPPPLPLCPPPPILSPDLNSTPLVPQPPPLPSSAQTLNFKTSSLDHDQDDSIKLNRTSQSDSVSQMDVINMKKNLKKVTKSPLNQANGSNQAEEIMQLIRQGVRLRHVHKDIDHKQSHPPSLRHTDILQNALARINQVLSPPDEDDEEELIESDFD